MSILDLTSTIDTGRESSPFPDCEAEADIEHSKMERKESPNNNHNFTERESENSTEMQEERMFCKSSLGLLIGLVVHMLKNIIEFVNDFAKNTLGLMNNNNILEEIENAKTNAVIADQVVNTREFHRMIRVASAKRGAVVDIMVKNDKKKQRASD